MRLASLIPLAGLAATSAAFLLPPNLDTATLDMTEDIKISLNDKTAQPFPFGSGWNLKVPCTNCLFYPQRSDAHIKGQASSLQFSVTMSPDNQLRLADVPVWPAFDSEPGVLLLQVLDHSTPETAEVEHVSQVRVNLNVAAQRHYLPEIGGEALKIFVDFTQIGKDDVHIPTVHIWAFKGNDGKLELAAVATSPEPAKQCDKFDFLCRANRILSSAKQGGKDVLAKIPFMPMPFHHSGAKKPCKGAKNGRPFHLNGGIDKFASDVTPFHAHHHHDGKVGDFAGALTPFHGHHHHHHDDKVFSGNVGMIKGHHHGGPGMTRPHPPCFRAKMARMGMALKHVLFTFILPILMGMAIGIIVPAIVMAVFTIVRSVFFPRREVVVPAVIVTEYTEYDGDEKSAFKRSSETGEESEKAALMTAETEHEEEDLPPYIAKE